MKTDINIVSPLGKEINNISQMKESLEMNINDETK